MAFERIDQNRAIELIKDEGAVVVDVRDPASYSAGHIQNALHLTQETVGEFISATNKTVPVIVCCYHGNSSQGAADFLNQQGFTRCYSLDGGYTAWQQAGLD